MKTKTKRIISSLARTDRLSSKKRKLSDAIFFNKIPKGARKWNADQWRIRAEQENRLKRGDLKFWKRVSPRRSQLKRYKSSYIKHIRSQRKSKYRRSRMNY